MNDQLDLDACRTALVRDECDRRGHDWIVHATVSGSPGAVACERCGRAHRIGASDVGTVLRERYDDAVTTAAAMSRRAIAAEAEVRRLRADRDDWKTAWKVLHDRYVARMADTLADPDHPDFQEQWR